MPGSNKRTARGVMARTLPFCFVSTFALAVDLTGCSGIPDDPLVFPGPGPTIRPTSRPNPSPNPSSSPNGGITILVPTPAPVLCVPAPVVLAVAQQTVISCTEQGYIGKFTTTVSDPAIASVKLAPGTFTLFYVSGVNAGTTSLSLKSGSGGVGQVTIKVSG